MGPNAAYFTWHAPLRGVLFQCTPCTQTRYMADNRRSIASILTEVGERLYSPRLFLSARGVLVSQSEGFVDLHCHLLPTLDDGAKSWEEALSMARMAVAEGVDLLVAECTCVRPPCARHCTWQDWLGVLPDLGAQRVLFTHLSDEVRERSAELLAQGPSDKDLQFADDGMQLEL